MLADNLGLSCFSDNRGISSWIDNIGQTLECGAGGDVFVIASRYIDDETFRNNLIGSPSGWFVRIT